MPTGRLKFYSAAKGFGFVSTDEGDIYISQKTVERFNIPTLTAGDRLSFDIVETKGRRHADNLKKIKPVVKSEEMQKDDAEDFEREWGLRPTR